MRSENYGAECFGMHHMVERTKKTFNEKMSSLGIKYVEPTEKFVRYHRFL